jgi:cytochrome c
MKGIKKVNGKVLASLALAGVLLACQPAAAKSKVSAKTLAEGEALAKGSDCFACHSLDHKVVGPAYIDVAKKYAKDKNAVAKLVKKVKAGGSGNWGAVPMAPHPNLSDADLKKIVQWVLASTETAPAK